jgi:HSP20 family protein
VILTRRPTSDDPFWGFRREVDRLFDDFFSGRGMTRWPGDGIDLRLDVGETDKELTITAELPGVDEKDVELTLAEDLLTIRGEKKREHEQRNGDYHMVERSYGSFARSPRLPFKVDQDKVDAKFEKGVLTIPAEAARDPAVDQADRDQVGPLIGSAPIKPVRRRLHAAAFVSGRCARRSPDHASAAERRRSRERGVSRIASTARGNPGFSPRAVRLMVGAGFEQFLDTGSATPTTWHRRVLATGKPRADRMDVPMTGELD